MMVEAYAVRIFDGDGNPLRTIPVPAGMWASDLALDGSVVATGDITGRVRLFDTETGAEIASPGWPEAEAYSSPIYGTRLSLDGATVAASTRFATRIWRVSDGSVVAEIPEFGGHMAFSATGELAISRDGAVEIFELPAGTTVASYPGGNSHVVYSADGTLLAFGSEARWTAEPRIQIMDRVHGVEAVKLFDDPQTRPPQIGPKSRYMVALTFAGPDRIAVAWDDGRLATFRLSDGALVWSRVDSD